MPICLYGCSQLCKLMATPTDEAWKAALHLLQYLLQHKDEGIVFSEVTCTSVQVTTITRRPYEISTYRSTTLTHSITVQMPQLRH